MRKSLLLASCAALVSFGAHGAELVLNDAAASAADPAISGYVELSGIGTDWDYWGDDYNPWLGFGGAAALAYRLDDSLQLEVELQSWTVGDGYYDGYYNVFGTLGAAHINWYSDNFSVGGFGGVLAANEYDNDGATYSLLAGLEGQLQISDAFVINGQVGFLKTVSGYYASYDPYPNGLAFGQVDAKFFPVDNVKLQASLGAIVGDVYQGYDAKTLTYGLEAEYQFQDTPFSVFAAYSGYTDNGYFDFNGNTVKVGARFSFDGTSLKDQATTGASHRVMDLSAFSWERFAW